MIPSDSIRMSRGLLSGAAVGALMLGLMAKPAVVQAQTSAAMMEEIVVTATKKSAGENIQDVPVSMTAFGSDQLDAFQVRNISDLSFKMPNVSLDDVGTTPGVANFAIRGLGVNSSIPSIDPAVGVFVDGMYMGINAGVIMDTFDLESVEALRGPQGVLFGRNVTGGAVLINTADPDYEFDWNAKAASDSGFRGTGLNNYIMGSVTGALVEDRLAARVGVYHNNDEGWFERTTPSGATERFGDSDTTVFRASIKADPIDSLSVIIKYEHGESDADGPAGQSHVNGSGVPGQVANFDRDSFEFSIDEPGFSDAEWDQIIAEVNWDVGFGDGTITNIFGYREFDQLGRSDIDASPSALFHANVGIDQEQISNELRYNGRFFDDRLDLTAGVYYFQQDLIYSEQRDLVFGALTQDGGGIQDHETYGAFANVEYDLTDRWSVNAGIRYSDEEKDVGIASLIANVNAPCTLISGDNRSTSTCALDFQDNFQTDNISGKVGVGYEFSDNARGYAHWSRSFRAGGYNFRNTSAVFPPGPFDDEEINAFEVGVKSEPLENARLNAAVFFNQMKDMQREINLSDPFAGVVQVIRNTADADIYGFEVDGQVQAWDNLILTASVGYVQGEYTDVIFDLTGDGVINAADEGLDIPRLANWTTNLGAVYIYDWAGFGEYVFQANYSTRSASAYTDSNLGRLNKADRVDASATLNLEQYPASITVYGKNLTNNVQIGNDTQLPSTLGGVPLGGTFAPLMKGRQIGLEVKLNY